MSQVGGWVHMKTLIRRYTWQHEYGRDPLIMYRETPD